MIFTIDDEHFIKCMWVKKQLCRETLAQDVFDRRWGKETDQNISARSLTLPHMQKKYAGDLSLLRRCIKMTDGLLLGC